MSLLEIITKASAATDQLTLESKYPIILNPNPIFLNLKPQIPESTDTSLVKRVDGWKISQTDADIIEVGQRFFKSLSRKLKNPTSFTKNAFIDMLNTYLEKNREKVGIQIGVGPKDEGYTSELIRNVGFLMGQAVLGLVLEACAVLELWELLEILIAHGLVEHSCSSKLVRNLIERRRSDLVCLCVKHVPDLHTDDVLLILKYFLSPPKDGYSSMASVRKEWESQALLAIKQSGDNRLPEKMISLAKDASVLLMMAHDGFSVSELCLHYLVALSNLDEVILLTCISKLNGSQMMGLIRYLDKWLKKYERFPQACPCPKASVLLDLRACDWVPTLEQIVNCLGLVLDEHFSSLVMHPEFHEELRSIGSVVNSLASEARLCCTLANVSSNLKPEI